MGDLANKIVERIPLEHIDEILFLSMCFFVGFLLILANQPDAGTKTIDATLGATLMWLKGKSS